MTASAQRLRHVEPRARPHRLSDGNGLALQKCGQLFRWAAGSGATDRDITRDLAGFSVM